MTEPEQARALVALHGAAGLGGDLNIDGSIGSHTAHLRSAYTDDAGCRGTAYRSGADVRDHVAACAAAGVQSGFHVIGDAGMDTVLEGYEAAAALVGLDVVRATRPRLEHAEMVERRGVATDGRARASSRACSRCSTPSGAGPTGCTRSGSDRARVPGTNPFADDCFGRVRLARLGLARHAVRPLGHCGRPL